MNLFTRSAKWVMLICGLLTCPTFQAAFAPTEWQQSIFGEALEGPLANVLVRHFGVLAGTVGLALIYGAFSEANRRFALAIAVVEKLAFVVLILTIGRRFLPFQAAAGVIIDGTMALLFIAYLIALPRKATPTVTAAT